MLNSKQCELLLNILNDQPFKGIHMAAEIVEIAKKLEDMKAEAEKSEK